MNELSTDKQILIEQRITNEAKSTVVAYLLWFFLGWFGGHRFYLGKTGSAIAQLLLTIVGFLTIALIVGILPLAIVGIWLLVDACTIPGMINRQRGELRDRLTSDAKILTPSSAPAGQTPPPAPL